MRWRWISAVRGDDDPLRVVLMGVTGSGKTTVGRLVATRVGVPFLDADDFHSRAAIARMRAGRPLDDTTRADWLQRVVAELQTIPDSAFVLACSALKRAYRETLRAGIGDLAFVLLHVSEETLMRRLDARVAHFAGPNLLPSQLATLEHDDDVVAVDAEAPPEVVATTVLRAVTLRAGRPRSPGALPEDPRV